MGINQHLDITVCEDARDATKQGFFYREPVYKGVTIDKVVVVKKGTVEGNSTVDFILVDATGQQYVVMVTGRLLKSIPTDFTGETK